MNNKGAETADFENNREVEISESESEFDLNDPLQAIKQIFNCFDTDGDGFIDRFVLFYSGFILLSK